MDLRECKVLFESCMLYIFTIVCTQSSGCIMFYLTEVLSLKMKRDNETETESRKLCSCIVPTAFSLSCLEAATC